MKAFWKTLIGGALGLSALYAVGRICYEAGKDMAEVERQLAEKTAAKPEEPRKTVTDEQGGEDCEQISMDIGEGGNGDETDPDGGIKVKKPKNYEISEKEFDEIWDRHTEYTRFGKLINRVRDKSQSLGTLIRAKRALGGGKREPGVLGTLLKNPDGAHIEACIENGGVRINVRPRMAGAAG